MISINDIKIIAILAIGLLAFSACRSKPVDSTDRPVVGPPPSRVPFSTTEPESYEVEIVITAGTSVRRYHVARAGLRRSVEFDAGTPSRLIVITDERVHHVLPEARSFAEPDAVGPFSNDDWSVFLTSRWLNSNQPATFEPIEPADGNERYRVTFGHERRSETIVTIDSVSRLPVRQEFFTLSGGAAVSTLTVELHGLKTVPDESRFTVPPDFKRVTAAELLKLR